MDRCDFIRAAFKRAGVENPTEDQLDTACSKMDGLEYDRGVLRKLTTTQRQNAADKAVALCLNGGGQ